MNKFRFSMLFAAVLTIASLALPASAASTPNPDNGSIGITTPLQPSTYNEQVAPPPDDGDFLPSVAPPPDDGDFLPSVAPPPDDGDFVPVAPPPDDGD